MTLTKMQIKAMKDARDIIRFKRIVLQMRDRGFTQEQLASMFRHIMQDGHTEEPEQVEYDQAQCGREK